MVIVRVAIEKVELMAAKGVSTALLVLACGACAAEVVEPDQNSSRTTVQAQREGSVEPPRGATTSSTVPQASTIPPASTNELASPVASTTEVIVPAQPCSLAEIGYQHLLVFGNSTDYTFQETDTIVMTAWPELLVANDDVGLLADVDVRNEAQPGQTMGNWDFLGPDPSLRLNGFARTLLDSVDPTVLNETLAIVAPSFIDLQENGFDVDRAVTDLFVVLATLTEFDLDTLVLPMNYVSVALNDRFPELNPTIEGFNRRLAERGVLDEPLVDSPLRLSLGPVGGDDVLYDDFPGRDKNGVFLGPDGIHPDAEGQLVKTRAVLDVLATLVARVEPRAACP